MKLYLIRHAQSYNNARPEAQRVEDPPLTAIGHDQARHLAGYLRRHRLERLITSPFLRALETTEHIRQATQLRPEVWVELHEQGGCQSGPDPLVYEARPGLSREQISSMFHDYLLPEGLDGAGWWKCRPYEESTQAQVRAQLLVRRIHRELVMSHQRVAFVMHGTFGRMLLDELLHQAGMENGWCGNFWNASVSELTVQPDQLRLESFSLIDHLPPDLHTL